MARLLCVLAVGLMLEAVGVVYLSRGLRDIGEPAKITLAEIGRFFIRAVTNRQLVAGVGFEAGFFVCLLYLMAKAEVSFIWPLTALSFVATTVAAKLFLHEQVSLLRWLGVGLILVGAAVITYTETTKRTPPRPPIEGPDSRNL